MGRNLEGSRPRADVAFYQMAFQYKSRMPDDHLPRSLLLVGGVLLLVDEDLAGERVSLRTVDKATARCILIFHFSSPLLVGVSCLPVFSLSVFLFSFSLCAKQRNDCIHNLNLFLIFSPPLATSQHFMGSSKLC